jgi:hypothetical protein
MQHAHPPFLHGVFAVLGQKAACFLTAQERQARMTLLRCW